MTGDLSLGEPLAPERSLSDDWLDALPAEAGLLFDYQERQIRQVAAALKQGYREILVQLPTGGGKTHEIAVLVKAAVASGRRVLILATRTRLVRQIHERLTEFGVKHGVIAASLPHGLDYSAWVQVASVDTLHRRAVTSGSMPLPPADVVIFDEAHLATAETRLRLLQRFPSAIRIGFTATPARKSGRSLGAAFKALIIGPSIRELIRQGRLVPTRIFNTPVVSEAELKDLPKDNDNDFQSTALGALMSKPKLIGDIVGNWFRIAGGKRTLCFAVNKSHAAALLDTFLRRGVAAEMLTDADDELVREEVLARLASGHTRVVINCHLLSYGVDVPSIECIVLGRPTRSLSMYLQAVGRGLRTSEGKAHCILIDHGHCVETLGLPQSDFKWSLNSDRNVNSEAIKRNSRHGGVESARTCPQCSALWLTSEQGKQCPECGWTAPVKSKAIEVQTAELRELAHDAEQLTAHDGPVVSFFQEACYWYARRWPDRWRLQPNKGRWWAWLQTRQKFKLPESSHIPGGYWGLPLLPSSADTSRWLQYRLIKFAKSKHRRAA